MSRAPRRRLVAVGLLVSLVGFGVPVLLAWLSDREDVGKMSFLTDIRPPGWRLAGGITPQAFMARAASMRELVDGYRERR